MGVEAQNAVSGRRPNSGLSHEINNDGRPRLVSMDGSNQNHGPSGHAHWDGVFVCLLPIGAQTT